VTPVSASTTVALASANSCTDGGSDRKQRSASTPEPTAIEADQVT